MEGWMGGEEGNDGRVVGLGGEGERGFGKGVGLRRIDAWIREEDFDDVDVAVLGGELDGLVVDCRGVGVGMREEKRDDRSLALGSRRSDGRVVVERSCDLWVGQEERERRGVAEPARLLQWHVVCRGRIKRRISQKSMDYIHGRDGGGKRERDTGIGEEEVGDLGVVSKGSSSQRVAAVDGRIDARVGEKDRDHVRVPVGTRHTDGIVVVGGRIYLGIGQDEGNNAVHTKGRCLDQVFVCWSDVGMGEDRADNGDVADGERHLEGGDPLGSEYLLGIRRIRVGMCQDTFDECEVVVADAKEQRASHFRGCGRRWGSREGEESRFDPAAGDAVGKPSLGAVLVGVEWVGREDGPENGGVKVARALRQREGCGGWEGE